MLPIAEKYLRTLKASGVAAEDIRKVRGALEKISDEWGREFKEDAIEWFLREHGTPFGYHAAACAYSDNNIYRKSYCVKN